MVRTRAGLVVVGFNRPAKLARVLQVAAEHWDGPTYVQIDAPRDGHPEDVEATEACRRVVRELLYASQLTSWSPEDNLGVARGVPAALDAAFSECDRLMVLEDDCLPHPDFFAFMPAMLDRFAGDTRVMGINGNTFGERFEGDGRFTFGQLAQAWGWATWRRAWNHYEQVLADPPEERRRVARRLPLTRRQERELLRRWDLVADPEHQITWDFQWQYAVARVDGQVVVPTRNLISNLGFGGDASHTHNRSDRRSNVPSLGLSGPYGDPRKIEADSQVTRRYARHMLGPRTIVGGFSRRIRDELQRVFASLAGW